MKIVLSVCTVAMASALLWHFSNIVRYGSHYIAEPKVMVLWSEVAVISGMLIVGIIGLWRCEVR